MASVLEQPPTEELRTYSYVAVRLGVSSRTVERWARAGRIRTVRLPGGGRRVPESVIAAIEQGEAGAK